jgi:hypothetical protein
VSSVLDSKFPVTESPGVGRCLRAGAPILFLLSRSVFVRSLRGERFLVRAAAHLSTIVLISALTIPPAWILASCAGLGLASQIFPSDFSAFYDLHSESRFLIRILFTVRCYQISMSVQVKADLLPLNFHSSQGLDLIAVDRF